MFSSLPSLLCRLVVVVANFRIYLKFSQQIPQFAILTKIGCINFCLLHNNCLYCSLYMSLFDDFIFYEFCRRWKRPVMLHHHHHQQQHQVDYTRQMKFNSCAFRSETLFIYWWIPAFCVAYTDVAMATQLALQRNFITIKSTNQSTSSGQVASATTTSDGDIVTITTAGNSNASNSSSGPIHVMQPVQQVRPSLNFVNILLCITKYLVCH